MSIYKRDKTWWTDFSVNGQRFRESLDTTDWREAQRLEKEKISEAQQGKLLPSSQQFSRLAFSEAADRYLESRKVELSPRSLKKERQLLVHPRQFWGNTPLNRINVESLLAYRESRGRAGRKPSYMNMEFGVIRRILKRARRWHSVAEDIKPLRERGQLGRALSPEQKLILMRRTDNRPEWQTIRWAAILALNTTMRGSELKGLQWRDVSLLDSAITVRRSKTEAGERIIPLNSEAMNTVVEIYKRAQLLNATDLDHYVFPACENGRIDPTRPQATWRTAWRHLTRSVECPMCGLLQNPGIQCEDDGCKTEIRDVRSLLAGLRFHDLRHHAITELAESQTSDQTVMAIAGHVSPRMLAHYSHVRLAAKRTALELLSKKSVQEVGSQSKTESHVTKYVTKPLLPPIPSPQVVEKYGRPVRTRTADLYRVKVAL
jgi:integrase